MLIYLQKTETSRSAFGLDFHLRVVDAKDASRQYVPPPDFPGDFEKLEIVLTLGRTARSLTFEAQDNPSWCKSCQTVGGGRCAPDCRHRRHRGRKIAQPLAPFRALRSHFQKLLTRSPS